MEARGVLLIIDAAVCADRPDLALEDLNTSGFLAESLPEVHAMVGFGGGDTGMKSLWDHTKQVVRQTTPEPRLRWAALFHDVGKVQTFGRNDHGDICFHGHEGLSGKLFRDVARRYGMRKDEMRVVSDLIVNLGLVEAYTSDWTDSAVRRLSLDVGPTIMDLLALSMADITTKHDNIRAKHHRSIQELCDRVAQLFILDTTPQALPTGLGDVLKAELGLPAGPELGRHMKALKAAVEAGKLPRNGPFEVYVEFVRQGS